MSMAAGSTTLEKVQTSAAPARSYWFAFAAATLGVAFYVAICSFVVPYARQHDFLSFYTGAAMVRDGHAADLYNYDVQTQRFGHLAPNEVVAPYIRPPFYA